MMSRETSETPPRPPRRIKILGERNSGTTWVEALLTRNFEIDCLPGGVHPWVQRWLPDREFVRDGFFRATAHRNLGWKHAIAPDAKHLARARIDPQDLLFVTLTKNPYAWLRSLHHRPYHARQTVGDLANFLSTPWRTVAREHAPARFANPIAIWNAKNASYLELADRVPTMNTRYEDWLADPIGRLEALGREWLLRPSRQPFENIEEASKRQDHGKRFEDYRDDYLKETWRAAFDADCIRCINEALDPELMARFGYQRIEPDG
jgi:hypothetical protein